MGREMGLEHQLHPRDLGKAQGSQTSNFREIAAARDAKHWHRPGLCRQKTGKPQPEPLEELNRAKRQSGKALLSNYFRPKTIRRGEA